MGGPGEDSCEDGGEDRSARRHQVRNEVVERARTGLLVEGEAGSIERFLVEFDQLSHPFDVDADPVHVTASAIVVDDGDDDGDDGAVLLLKHKRLGMWLQPGGHVDAGEHPRDAALREACEETGIELALVDGQLIHVDVHPGGRGHLHLDLRYLVRPVTGADPTPAPPPEESQDVVWFSPSDAIVRASDDRLAALLRSLVTRSDDPASRGVDDVEGDRRSG